MKTQSQNGFTLYELMITVLILGVVLAFGIPNFSEFTANSRMTAASNDLLSSFLAARSEAARAKSNVTICAGTAAGCGGTFNDGWIIFEDSDGDITLDGGESVLKVFPPTPNGVVITTDANANYFSFAATGLGRGDVNAAPSFVGAIICDGRGKQVAAGGRSAARILIVTPIGRATVLSSMDTVAANPRNCP